jgi:hypothetical protein
MHAGPASRIEPVSVGAFEYLLLGWRQAGFVSFAYRLAHLRTPRTLIMGAIAALFILL